MEKIKEAFGIVSDVHKEHGLLEDVLARLEKEKIGALACLGDLDDIEALRMLMEWKAGKRLFQVLSNHDFAALHETHAPMESRTTRWEDILNFRGSLDADAEAKSYFGSLPLSETVTIESLFGPFKAFFVHGALRGKTAHRGITRPGDIGVEIGQQELYYLWADIVDEQDEDANFVEMIARKISLLVRGHQHSASFIDSKGTRVEPRKTERIALRPGVEQIATMPALTPAYGAPGYAVCFPRGTKKIKRPFLEYRMF
jgi:predicted phosphodiesterase